MRVHASPKLEESTLRIRTHTHTHTMCTKDAFSSSGWCIQSPRGSWLRQLQLFSLSPSRPAWGSARCPPAFLSLPDPPRSLKMGQTEEVKCRGNKSRVKWNLLKTKPLRTVTFTSITPYRFAKLAHKWTAEQGLPPGAPTLPCKLTTFCLNFTAILKDLSHFRADGPFT